MPRRIDTSKMVCQTLVALALIWCLLTACSSQATPSPGSLAVTAEAPTMGPVTPSPDQSAYRAAWRQSAHAAGYDLESGPNTYCARCHSPANWDPSAVIDEPPNCLNCKFPFETEPRQAEGNQLIPEPLWVGIDCPVCHKVENGVVVATLMWHDEASGYDETLDTPQALCEKCHRDTEVLRHAIDFDDGPHSDFDCMDCHADHTLVAGCGACHRMNRHQPPEPIVEHEGLSSNESCLECHPDVAADHDDEMTADETADCLACHEAIMAPGLITRRALGHSDLHHMVDCVACHDAAGLAVQPLEGGGLWITWRTSDFMGQPDSEPYQSHHLQREVDCQRCHYRLNPWGLPEVEGEEGGYGGS